MILDFINVLEKWLLEDSERRHIVIVRGKQWAIVAGESISDLQNSVPISSGAGQTFETATERLCWRLGLLHEEKVQ